MNTPKNKNLQRLSLPKKACKENEANENCKLILGDCLEKLKEIPDNSIDLVLTDPPYCNVFNVDWDRFNKNEFLDFMEKVVIESKRILKENGSIYIFGMLPIVKNISLIMDKYFIYQNWITWAKCRGRNTTNKFGSNREEILFYTKGDIPRTFHRQDTTIKRQYGGGDKRDYVLKGKTPREFVIATDVWTDIMEVGISPKEKSSGHPTQKPIKLINRIVSASSDKDNLILDPFMGSGTTGVAALKLQRRFIGIEINPEYFKIAERRINEWKNQTRL